jgi:hypothetical protein
MLDGKQLAATQLIARYHKAPRRTKPETPVIVAFGLKPNDVTTANESRGRLSR